MVSAWAAATRVARERMKARRGRGIGKGGRGKGMGERGWGKGGWGMSYIYNTRTGAELRGMGERAEVCKGANRPTACGKVNTKIGRGRTEDRVQSTDYGGKVGTWLCRVLVFIGGQGEALPLPASGARERQEGQHVVPTLPDTE